MVDYCKKDSLVLNLLTVHFIPIQIATVVKSNFYVTQPIVKELWTNLVV